MKTRPLKRIEQAAMKTRLQKIYHKTFNTNDQNNQARGQYLNHPGEPASMADTTIGNNTQPPKGYQNSCDENQEPKDYQKTSNTNDRKNNQMNGHKSHPRRRYTTKTRKRCTASIIICRDQHSFYMKCGMGCAENCGHVQMAQAEVQDSIRVLSNGELINVAVMAAANTRPSTAAAILNAQTGLAISRKQIAYLLGMNRLADKLNSDVIHRALSRSQKEEEKWSADDNMLEYLERIGASYCCLYHSGASSELRQNQKSKYYIVDMQYPLLIQLSQASHRCFL
jgi:hypothetical protein